MAGDPTPARVTELSAGDLVTYHGTAQARAMQRAHVVVPRTDAFVAVRFLDGVALLARRQHVTRVVAPQWEPDF